MLLASGSDAAIRSAPHCPVVLLLMPCCLYCVRSARGHGGGQAHTPILSWNWISIESDLINFDATKFNFIN